MVGVRRQVIRSLCSTALKEAATASDCRRPVKLQLHRLLHRAGSSTGKPGKAGQSRLLDWGRCSMTRCDPNAQRWRREHTSVAGLYHGAAHSLTKKDRAGLTRLHRRQSPSSPHRAFQTLEARRTLSTGSGRPPSGHLGKTFHGSQGGQTQRHRRKQDSP